jgi:hypothetical protein
VREVYDNDVSQLKLWLVANGCYQVRRRDRMHDDVGGYWTTWQTVIWYCGSPPNDELAAERELYQWAIALGYRRVR